MNNLFPYFCGKLVIFISSLAVISGALAGPFPDMPLLTGTESCDSGPERSLSPITSSNNRYRTGTLAFNASYRSGAWSGDVIASDISTGAVRWKLSDTFNSGGVNANFKDRVILRSWGSSSNIFASDLKMAATSGSPDAKDTFNWLRGDQSKEDGVDFRIRSYPIGDIVHSNPAYLPGNGKNQPGYVYIGANDGMLHGINADTGKVVFSFIPKGVDIATLATLRDPEYKHRFFVDGAIDAIGPNRFVQKNIVLAAMGRGGRGAFALNTDDPETMATTDNRVIFDYTSAPGDTTSNPDMGYILGAVHLRAIRNTTTSTTMQPLRVAVLFPNGIDSPNGEAKLFVGLLRADGSHAAGGLTWPTDGSKNNGMISIALADMDGDGSVDMVYGGDLKGNIWVWDFKDGYLSGLIPNSPGPKVRKVFSGDPMQPVSGLALTQREDGKIIVAFGTGRYFSEEDRAPGRPQRLYGIIDDGQTIITAADLTRRNLNGPSAVPVLEHYQALSMDSHGWYIDLSPPERVLHSPVIIGSALYFNLISPPETAGRSCDAVEAGSSRIVGINIFTGTSTRPTASASATAETMLYFPDSLTDGVINQGFNTNLRLLSSDEGDGKTYLLTNHGTLNLPDTVPSFDLSNYLKGGRLHWREVLR